MIRRLKLWAILIVIASCQSQNDTIEIDEKNHPNSVRKSIKLPLKISSLIKGIDVKHSKKKVYPELNEELPTRALKYKFNFGTSVISLQDGLEIIEFGAFHQINNKWVQSSARPFNTAEFAEWYLCPSGLPVKGVMYSDPNNWYSCDDLDKAPSKILWYYIGVDSNNEKFVGFDTIELLSELTE